MDAGENGTAWETLESREVFGAPPWFHVMRERVRLPDGRVVDDYHRIVLADFAIIFAETADGHVLVERQYKHGPGTTGLSLPAGTVAPGESPLEAARRELLEETGYVADDWRALGQYAMNGNYGCGWAHIFRARGARKVAAPDSGDLEAMEILLVPISEVRARFDAAGTQLLGSVAAVLIALADAQKG